MGLCFSLSACDPVSEIKSWLGVGAKTAESPLPTDMKSEMNSATDAQDPSKKPGELAKANQELLSEMIRVVFNRDEILEEDGYPGLVQALNQGASLEGIYRGIVFGSHYRGLEGKAQGASPEMLRAFAEELSEVQDSMKSPTVFNADEAKGAPVIEFPDGSEPSKPATAPTASVELKRVEKAERIKNYLVLFIGASDFTLKRVLGEEVLRRFDESKSDPADAAQWYAGFVVRMASKKVDFGLELRNRADLDFHVRFAKQMAMDRVKWEALNRVHRYLNAFLSR